MITMENVRSRIRELFAFFHRVPFVVPVWESTEFVIIAKLLLTGRLVQGKSCDSFVRAFGDLLHVPYAVPTNLGRTAIEIALKALGIGRGHEVLISTQACGAAALPILRLGAKPVFCDVDDNFNITHHIASQLTSRTRAIIVIHNGGKLVDLGPLLALAQKRNIAIIEDACQALGAQYKDAAYAGTKGTIGVFSFGMGKNLMATGGGMAVTHDAALFERMQRYCTQAEPYHVVVRRLFMVLWQFRFRKYTSILSMCLEYLWSTFRTEAPRPYQIARLSNLDAALMESQLSKMGRIIAGRITNAKRLNALVRTNPRVHTVPAQRCVYTKYQLFFNFDRFASNDRAITRYCKRFFAERGIELEEPHTPLHLREPFRQYGSGSLPNAERLYAGTVIIPVRPNLRPGEQRRIVRTLRAFLQQLGRMSIRNSGGA